MKKSLIFLLVALLLLCFSACDEANVNGETNNTTDGQESTEGTTPGTNDSANSTGGTTESSTNETEGTEKDSDSEKKPSVSIPTIDPFVPPTTDPVECHHIFLNHNITITKPATCEEVGEKNGTCLYCHKEITSTIPALGHETVIDKGIAPSCTQDGKTEGSHCSRCNEVFAEQEVIPALGGEHIIVIDEAVEPTCSKTGLSEGKHCSRCGKIYVIQAVIPTKSHVMGDLIVDKEPTCTEDGKQYKACENCDYREEYSILASHKYTVTEKDSIKTFSCNMCDRIVENVEDIIILFQPNEDGTYTVEVSGGYGEVDYVWIAWTSMPTVNDGGWHHTSITPFSFHLTLPSTVFTYQSITITATDELGQRAVYNFKLPNAELISSEHTIVDKSSP